MREQIFLHQIFDGTGTQKSIQVVMNHTHPHCITIDHIISITLMLLACVPFNIQLQSWRCLQSMCCYPRKCNILNVTSNIINNSDEVCKNGICKKLLHLV